MACWAKAIRLGAAKQVVAAETTAELLCGLGGN